MNEIFETEELTFEEVPSVKSANGIPGQEGKFYITATARCGSVEGTNPMILYLHQDLCWRRTATSSSNRDGYYKSESEAKNFLSATMNDSLGDSDLASRADSEVAEARARKREYK